MKPAWEPVVVARKPLIGTVAANVQAHGTGALNIDGTRIAFVSSEDKAAAAAAAAAQRASHDQNAGRTAYCDFNNGPASLAPYLANMDKGRWPANVVLDEAAAALVDEQSGDRHGMASQVDTKATPSRYFGLDKQPGIREGRGDFGGASRFFYTAKASRSEREAGLREAGLREAEARSGLGGEMPTDDEGRERDRFRKIARNTHPTVKPVDLMRWLVRLVTPPGGLVLDPFTGSGTTGIAAHLEGCRFLGIEREPAYVEIARARIKAEAAQGTFDLGAPHAP